MIKRKRVLPIYCIDETFKIVMINLLALNYIEGKASSKAWRENNPDKVKSYNKDYYQYNSDQLKITSKARSRVRYATNPGKSAVESRSYREANIEKIAARNKIYYKVNVHKICAGVKLWVKSNPEKVKAAKQAWAIANPEIRREIKRRRRAKIANSEGFLTAREEQQILQDQNYACVYCDADLNNGYHADHIVPISKGGSSWKDNYQMLCPNCNYKKNAKLPWDYEKEIGFPRDISFWDNLNLYNTPESVTQYMRELENIKY